MLNVELAVKLTVKAPFSTRSSEMGRIGIDAPLARSGQGGADPQGRPYIPGTLVKGRLRQSWRELHSAAGEMFNPDLGELLGNPAANETQPHNGTVKPSRGSLYFSDFFLIDEAKHAPEITRIEMNPDLGSVKKGSYQVIETPDLPGAKLTFAGSIRYFTLDREAADRIRKYVETGLRWTTGFGAERTVGFGCLLDVEIGEKAESAFRPGPSIQSSGGEMNLFIEFAGPFCVAKRRLSDNLFQSDWTIPGSVLKGAVAFSWSVLVGKQGTAVAEDFDLQRPELSRHFEKIRFTQALPCRAGDTETVRLVFPPLSLAKTKTALYDVLLCEKPQLIGGEAPAFSIDWKDDADVRKAFGWPAVATQLRVRTAISETQRRAEDSMLFAYEQVQPDGLLWHARVDLSRVPENDRLGVENQLRSLLNSGIHALGKTKVSGIVTFGRPLPLARPTAKPDNDLYAITLQSPALLCDPRHIEHASEQEALQRAYSAVWSDLSGNSLELMRYFARQSLAGGFYLHRRYQSGKTYAPWLLTDAGSVFLLRKKKEDASDLIESWLKAGLPLPSWAAERYGDHWTTCPYLPENGYGDIVVNLDVHTTMRPALP
jgi:hypothetical protein